MKTFLIDTKGKHRIEVIDQVNFDIGTKLVLPAWSNKVFVVTEVVFIATTMPESGCSFNQHIYVKETK